VMGHGFSGTQDRLFANAERFAGAGFGVLTFDYRNFGESGGQPRQLVSIKGQLEDWRAAIRFARTLEGLDPEKLVLWGSSLGGGHAIVVDAEDPRIAAVVTQIPFNGFPRRVEGRSTLDTLKLLWAMTVDAARGRLGRPPYYIPMVGKPGEVAVTATPEAQEHIAALSGETRDSLWRNEVAPRALFAMMRYRPGDEAHRLGMPVLVCIAERDLETPEERARRIAERRRAGSCVATRSPTSTSTVTQCVNVYSPTRSTSCARTCKFRENPFRNCPKRVQRVVIRYCSTHEKDIPNGPLRWRVVLHRAPSPCS